MDDYGGEERRHMQRREDQYQVPARVLEELAETAARKAIHEATPEIVKAAAELGVQIAMDSIQREAGAGLFRIVKYVAIAGLLAIAGWLAVLNAKISP